jgi:nitrogenase molybdenum-iron protein alpha/beta subunit
VSNRYQSLPFLNGVYIGVDAVPGSTLIVDGPYCVSTKAEMQHCHNLASRVCRPLGRPAVVHTAGSVPTEDVAWLASDRVAVVESVFQEVLSWPESRAVYATSFDFHELTAFPLKDICLRFSRLGGKPVRFIPSASLGGNWLDGYARFCDALARGIHLPPARPEPRTAAIVGYLFDRDEPDRRGDLKELERLLAGLGWKTASVWLSGKGEEGLAEVRRASVIVSLPYARQAARTLGRRLRRRVVEADLPMGLKGTEDFLLRLGRAFGCEAAASRLAGREARKAVADTQAHVQRFLGGRSAELLNDDPAETRALAGLCAELGLAVCDPASTNGDDEGDDRAMIGFGSSPCSSECFINVTIGYPDYVHHPVLDRPLLGYAGFRHLVDRLCRDVLSHEAELGGRPRASPDGR